MIKTTAIMKRYKLTLIPGDKVFDFLFDSKQTASIFACQYISNHPDDGLNMFDFRLEEYDMVATDITFYDKAVDSLGGVKYVNISVDTENKETLDTLDALLTIARAWNTVDCTSESLPHPEQTRYFPQFSYVQDEEQHNFCYEQPMASEHDFGIDALLSFRTNELAEAFSSTFKKSFAKLFNVPFNE